MKVVLARSEAGFILGPEAFAVLAEWEREAGQSPRPWWEWEEALNADRGGEVLVRLVEKLGTGASGTGADLQLIEVPEGIQWEIVAEDGVEHIRERRQV